MCPTATVTVLVPVAWFAKRWLTTPRSSLSTRDYVRSGDVFELLPSWRLHLSVVSRWLPGYLFGTGGVDPTTGKARSYWSYKADAYEQMAPKETLAHIARNFGVQSWKTRLAATVKEAEVLSNDLGDEALDRAEVSSIDLRASLRRLLPATACSADNAVRVPVDGNQAFEWRRKLIRNAKKQILFMTAYMSVDADAQVIAGDLADAVKRGVDVHVAFDNFGADAFVFCGKDTRYTEKGGQSFGYEDLVHTLRAAGCKICFWRAADCLKARGCSSGGNGANYQLLDCKNHIKCYIMDGELAILTDRNVGSCYFRNPDYSSTEVALAGLCVAELAARFSGLWDAAGGQPKIQAMAGIEATAAAAPRGPLFASLRDSPEDDQKRLATDAWGAVIVSTPRTLESGEDPVLAALLLAVRAAKRSVDLMYAYMEISRPLRDELMAALRRGVEVRVVTNSRATNDLFWINAAFLQSVLPVVKAGGKLVMGICTPTGTGHVHAKVAVMDKRWLLVGSWNAWLRSTFYEVEANVLLDSPLLSTAVAKQMDDLQASDAYRTFDQEQIALELASDPLGVDPDVAPFL